MKKKKKGKNKNKVMLHKTTWLHTPGCLGLGEWLLSLSESLRPFLYSSSMYSCHLFLISSGPLGPYNFYPLTSCVWSEIAQSCPTLCKPMDCSLPGSSIHGIFKARILEWVAISFSRRSSRPRDWTQVSRIVGRHFTLWATREVFNIILHSKRLNTFPKYIISTMQQNKD